MFGRLGLLGALWTACSTPHVPAAPAPMPTRSHAPAPAPALPDPAPDQPRRSRIEMTFVGDLMFGGYFKDRYRPYPAERHDPLAEVANLLASDLAVGNLETTIARALPDDAVGDFRFVTLPSRAAVLRDRIHAVTLANNHMFDNDVGGLADTTEILGELGVRFVGAARPEAPRFRADELRVGGWRVGFIAVSTRLNRRPRPTALPLLPFALPEVVRDELVPVIAAARTHHDLVVVLVHWGNEYEDAPQPWQIETAHAFVDAGAHVVIGHHPHVLQGVERYRDALIAYSLGNFVFPNARKLAPSGVLRLGFANPDAPCLDTITFDPVVQRSHPIIHPALPTARERAAIANHLRALSTPFATGWSTSPQRLALEPVCVSAPASSSASPAGS